MTEYIKWLRSYVGNKPLIQCGTGVIIENDKGEILLIKRTDNKCWGYPGGSVELGERVEDTAKREVFEETGLVAENLSLFSVFSGEEIHYVYPNGDEVYNIDIVYICKKYSGVPTPDGVESEDIQFFSIDNLPENISPPLAKPISEYINMRKNKPAV